MAETTALTLDEINAAIRTILSGGQEYTIGDRKLRRADLADLMNLRAQLAGTESTSDAYPLMPGVCVSVFDRR